MHCLFLSSLKVSLITWTGISPNIINMPKSIHHTCAKKILSCMIAEQLLAVTLSFQNYIREKMYIYMYNDISVSMIKLT